MGRFRRIALSSCLLFACSKSAPDEPAPVRAPAPAPRQPESPFDAQGRLKPSAERVDWLPIPQGFQRRPDLDERHLRFEANDMPLDKVREFLSAHALTGVVEEKSSRVIYRAVQPIESDPQAVPLDIALSTRPVQRGVLLEITRYTYGDKKPITVDEARRQLAEERNRAE